MEVERLVNLYGIKFNLKIMENPTPHKRLTAGFWIGIGIASFISIILMGMAAFVLVDFFNAPKAKTVEYTDVSRLPPSGDYEESFPDPIDGQDSVFMVVEKMPEFKGGDEARIKFLTQNIRYPQLAKEEGIQGTVFVTFIIDETGRVSSAKVIRGIGGGCDEEALRVVSLMPRWKPGKQSGKNVRVQFNMLIKFTLN